MYLTSLLYNVGLSIVYLHHLFRICVIVLDAEIANVAQNVCH